MKIPVLTVVGPAEVTHFYSIETTVLNFFITLLEFILCQSVKRKYLCSGEIHMQEKVGNLSIVTNKHWMQNSREKVFPEKKKQRLLV